MTLRSSVATLHKRTRSRTLSESYVIFSLLGLRIFFFSSISESFLQSGTTCIIHTAAPPPGKGNEALHRKVNVEGTKAIIAAAVECGVRKLVYTSSAGTVYDGHDLIDCDERMPFPEVPMDIYNETKAQAEKIVLEANGKDGLLTIALRPAGIFGYATYFLSAFSKMS